MSGSRRWFRYLDDTGMEYAMETDESKAEIGALGFAALTAGASGPVANGRILRLGSKRPLTPRYVIATRPDADGRTLRRKFYVGTAFAFNALKAVGTIAGEGGSWSITQFKGEVVVAVPAEDTGLIDGDVDDNFAAAP